MPGQMVKQVEGLKLRVDSSHSVVEAIFHTATTQTATIQFSLINARMEATAGSGGGQAEISIVLRLHGPTATQQIVLRTAQPVRHSTSGELLTTMLTLPSPASIPATPTLTLVPGHYVVEAQVTCQSSSGNVLNLIAARAAIAVATS